MNHKFPIKLFFSALLIYLFCFLFGSVFFKFIVLKFYPNLNTFYFYFYFLVVAFVSLILFTLYSLNPLLKMISSLNYLVDNQNLSEDQITKTLAYENVPGEWNDLDALIRKLIKILRKNFKALSREKIEIQAIMNSVEDPIFAIDQTERVIFYNPAFGMFFGLETGSLEELQAHQVLPEAHILGYLREVLKSGEPITSQVDTVIRAKSFSFLISATPLKRETDFSTYGVVVVFRDRTLQVETNKKRLDFVANASHELRTPVATIASGMSLVEKNLNNPELVKEIVQNLKENTQRLVSLTEGLLDLSTLESGEVLNIQLIPVKNFTDKLIQQNGFPMERIQVNAPSDLFVNADPRRLDQLLTNLLTNAFRYSSQDKKIFLNWELTDTDVVLRVRDQGKGIPSEHAKRIFERFYRIDEARTRKFGGAGIGLAIVKHIMKLHKGDVYVNPDYKSGAEFICSFPNKD